MSAKMVEELDNLLRLLEKLRTPETVDTATLVMELGAASELPESRAGLRAAREMAARERRVCPDGDFSAFEELLTRAEAAFVRYEAALESCAAELNRRVPIPEVKP